MQTEVYGDTEFEETTIAKVEQQAGGWWIERADGWSFFISADSLVKPHTSDTIRFYGQGIGRPVRGVTINGQVIFYRTVEQQKKHQDHELYGTIPQDLIERWDAGKSIWSIEMGGLGPGYEQAIQVAAIEILRQMIAESPNAADWDQDGGVRAYSDTLHGKIGDILSDLGLSGAQFGAALNIAVRIYKFGPRDFAKSIPDDRKIQVSNYWPRVKERAAA